MRPWKKERLVFVDTETTGLDPKTERIIELGWVVTNKGYVVEQHNVLLQPGKKLPAKIIEITGITDEMIEDQPPFWPEASKRLIYEINVCATAAVAYNAPFDRAFLWEEISRGLVSPAMLGVFIDPLVFVRHFDKYAKGKGRHKLANIAERHGISAMGDAHRALVDCLLCKGVLDHYAWQLPDDLDELIEQQEQWREEQDREFQAWKARQAG